MEQELVQMMITGNKMVVSNKKIKRRESGNMRIDKSKTETHGIPPATH